MKKAITVTIFILCLSAAQAQQPIKPAAVETPKPIHLTPAQVRYYESINQEVEALPEVKALRAKQQGFITGIAAANGIEGGWRLVPDGKGGAAIETVTAKDK